MRSETSEKPAKVEVGQRWLYQGDEYEVIERRQPYCNGYLWKVKPIGAGLETQLAIDAPMFSRFFIYLGGPTKEETPRPAVDWARWLPPGPLPDSGRKMFLKGQVWAYHRDGASYTRAVFRIRGDHAETNHEVLAGGGQIFMSERDSRVYFFMSECDGGVYCVLVADVGCEPTPPEVLYAPSPSTERPPAPVKPAPSLKREVSEPRGYGGKTWAQHIEEDQRVGWEMCARARDILARSRLEAMIEAGRVPKPTPYVCPVDDYDLLADQGTSYRAPTRTGEGER